MQELIHNTIQYNFATPKNFDPARKYPLIIYFHGSGGIGHDLKQVRYPYMLEAYIQEQDLDAVVAAPLCEFHSWYMCFSELIEFVRFIAAEDFVDPDRVYLMGSSMGGYATFTMLMCVHELIAAAVPMCGGGAPHHAYHFRNVPLRVVHSSDDGSVAVSESVKMVESAHFYGSEVVEFDLLHGRGHNVWEPALYELGCVEWLLKHRLSERTSDSV